MNTLNAPDIQTKLVDLTGLGHNIQHLKSMQNQKVIFYIFQHLIMETQEEWSNQHFLQINTLVL